jgi:hypothetical protein
MMVDPRPMNPAVIRHMVTYVRNMGVSCQFPNSNQWWIEYAIPRGAVVLDIPIAQ